MDLVALYSKVKLFRHAGRHRNGEERPVRYCTESETPQEEHNLTETQGTKCFFCLYLVAVD